MIDTIELLTDQGVIWKLTDNNISDEHFRLGFLYGGLFIINKIPSTLNPHFVVYDHIDRQPVDPMFPGQYSSVMDIANDYFSYISDTDIPLDEIRAHVRDELDEIEIWVKAGVIPTPYLVSLLDPFDESKANLFSIESPTFFQGLFTVLNAAEIPYEKVVLHKPIRAGIAYNILDLNLLRLEDL